QRVLSSPDVKKIRFLPLRPSIVDPSVSIANVGQVSIQRYAPVEFLVFKPTGPAYVLGGYIEVELGLTSAVRDFKRDLKIRLVFLLMSAIALWFLIGLWTRRAVTPLTRVNQLAEQLRQGNPVVARLERHPVKVQELGLLERELDELSAQIQTFKHQVQDLNLMVEQLCQRERVAQSSRDHFQAMITHELKSPLNAILGGVQLLKTSALDSHQLDNVQLIADGSRYLSQLLDQVLALLSLEQGQITLHHEVFDPIQVLSQLMEEHQPRASAQQLPLELDVQHTPVMLHADVSKIHQILTALLDNALKFTPQGSVRVSSWLEQQQEDLLIWVCEVADTGIGIDEKVHAEVFKPFFQVDTTQTRRYEGAGMGLALAQRLTQMMDGELRLISQPEQGSRFQLRLPLRYWQHAQVTDVLTGRRIVVYETGHAEGMCNMLVDLGIQVDRSRSIEHVLQLCLSEQIDAVLICIHVPSSGVRQLVLRLREQVTDQHVVVIQAVQADEAIDHDQGYALGIDHWIRTSVTPSELADQLGQWLG
ncbi:MAG: HAMP domain-containing sensor histidine kinase, partial [Pseudomonadota bacterium]|nr:HAMP domain-containing sensor histidine kinase [Pseudomonadota bacterium]